MEDKLVQFGDQVVAFPADMSDADIDRLRRGGHDPLKIYAAYHAALRHTGQPTVILAQTKKGYGMGPIGQGKMGTHQQKKLDHQALLAFRDRFDLPLSDEDTRTLMVKSREAKEILSTQSETHIDAVLNSGEEVRLTLTETEFAAMTQHLISKTITACRKAMRDAATAERNFRQRRASAAVA